ncbi:MAG: cob(I)yrinic acid a,c-diamide adenosyltransferase [Gemmatimonadota bacterium]
MKIYTRGGDRGETGLLGKERVPKTDLRVVAYGSVDELSAAIGLALALDEEGLADRQKLEAVQEDLISIGARLAAAEPEAAVRRGVIPGFSASRTQALEEWIDRLEAELPELDAFVLPGGHPAAAQLHVARTVCRRAERAVVRLLEQQPELAEAVVPYLNRLSDLLFTLARGVNRRAGCAESEWLPLRRREER